MQPPVKLDMWSCLPTNVPVTKETLRQMADMEPESPCGKKAAAMLAEWERENPSLPDDIGVTAKQGKLLGVKIPRNFGGG